MRTVPNPEGLSPLASEGVAIGTGDDAVLVIGSMVPSPSPNTAGLCGRRSGTRGAGPDERFESEKFGVSSGSELPLLYG